MDGRVDDDKEVGHYKDAVMGDIEDDEHRQEKD